MRRLLAICVVAVAVAAAFLAVGASGGGGGSSVTYKVQFDNAFGLVENGDFRVGGVTAGKTKSFEVREEPGRPVAEATVNITERGFGDLYQNASCDIKPSR